MRQAIEALQGNIVTQNAKREILSQIDDYCMKKLKVKAIEVLQNHAQKRQKTRAKLATHLRLKQKQLI